MAKTYERRVLNEEAQALGDYLRQKRRSRKSSIVAAAARLQASKNTIVDYELGRALPDLTFLALHAVSYGSDFTALLVMRLNADPQRAVKQLVDGVLAQQPQLLEKSAHLSWAVRPELLSDVVEVVEKEEATWRTRRLSPRQKGTFIAATYNFLHQFGRVDMSMIKMQVMALRSSAERKRDLEES